MEFLVFQLQAPLSSWGEPAVGEYRGSALHPSQSALIGLLGAALGMRREDEAAHARLRDGLCFAVGVLSGGSLMRDFHTAQVPKQSALKNRAHATRQHELAVDSQDLSTILSTRDHRQNAASLVAVQARANVASSAYSLGQLAGALRRPQFTLYLGRKACVPAAPLWPQVIEGESAHAAMQRYTQQFEQARQSAVDRRGIAPLEPMPRLQSLAFDDHIVAGAMADLTTPRKDRLVRREGWQFADRNEHVALMPTVRAPELSENREE